MITCRIKKFLSVFLAFALLLSFAFAVNAVSTDKAMLSFENNENDITVSVVIPSPEKLSAIDFSISVISDSASISDMSFTGSDIEASALHSSELSDELTDENQFIYYHSMSDKKLSFSGYFIDSFSKDTDFLLCRITLKKSDNENNIHGIDFSYTLELADTSVSDSVSYELDFTEAENNTVNSKPDTSAVTPSYLTGDVNFDGKVSADDARSVLRAAVGIQLLPVNSMAYANVDYDNAITSSDARSVLRLSVGLETPVRHQFDVAIDKNSLCSNGGSYTFYCGLTATAYTIELQSSEHIFNDASCINAKKCIICGYKEAEATGHNFNKNGICTTCNIQKSGLEHIEHELVLLLDEISAYDAIADSALNKNNNTDFVTYAAKSALLIKEAAQLCEDTTGLECTYSYLMTAYNIRFNAFLACMDKNGLILTDKDSCNTILLSVIFSRFYLSYAAEIYQ